MRMFYLLENVLPYFFNEDIMVLVFPRHLARPCPPKGDRVTEKGRVTCVGAPQR